MQFAIPPAIEARLREIAAREGRDLQSLVNDALRAFAEHDAPTTTNGHSAPASRYPLHGSVIRFDDPHAPALPDSDWEALG